MDENQNGSENRIDCVNHVFQSIAAGNTQAVRQYLSSGNKFLLSTWVNTHSGAYTGIVQQGGGM